MNRIGIVAGSLAGFSLLVGQSALADSPLFEATVTVVENGVAWNTIPEPAEFARLEFLAVGKPSDAITAGSTANPATDANLPAEETPSTSQFENLSDIAEYSEILRLQN